MQTAYCSIGMHVPMYMCAGGKSRVSVELKSYEAEVQDIQREKPT